jgi:hypothetical protein
LRNSQLCDDLISRARSLEQFLGVERGPYMRRSKNIWPLQHDVALFLIYLLVLAAWLVSQRRHLAILCHQGGCLAKTHTGLPTPKREPSRRSQGTSEGEGATLSLFGREVAQGIPVQSTFGGGD